MRNEKRLLRARGICVIIPTFNNEKTIGKVVKETLCFCDDVIVVNDGCTDSTAQIIGEIDNITVVAYSQNRGKGYALQQGFRKALSMGFAYAITLDADGQHKPEDIPLFLKANQEHPGALIIGARPLQGVERSKGSDFANQFSNFWFFVQTGKRWKIPRPVIASTLCTNSTAYPCSPTDTKLNWNSWFSPPGTERRLFPSLSRYIIRHAKNG